MDSKQLVEIFMRRGMIDQYLAQDIVDEEHTTGKDMPQILADFQVITKPSDVWPVIASEMGVELIDIADFNPTKELLDMIPPAMARLHGVLPVNLAADGLHVVMCDPLNPQAAEDLRFALGKDIVVQVADGEIVEEKINEFYDSSGKSLETLLENAVVKNDDLDPSSVDLAAEANSAPIIRYVDLIMLQAVREKASDIHFEPFETDFKIRYRVDGNLAEMQPPPLKLALPIISRVKVMASMNISENRIPQDGRIVKVIEGKQVDMRVSSLPTQHGESVVLRILDRSNVSLSLKELGLPTDVDEFVNYTIRRPNGIFVVTGPTGAGKTTTLYAALREINTMDSKLLTAEDPVEYDIDGIIQVPVNEQINLTFPSILRAFLRQDPDRILVGEIRDKDTAQIAIQASLTGHLVLSTLHTNDAPGAVTRLVDMGVEPFLVAASLEGVLGQRLVRKICNECRVGYEPSHNVMSQLGLSAHELGDKEFFTGKGCPVCSDIGLKGRQGLFELLNVTDSIRDLITDRAPNVVIKQKAIEQGMTTLREDGLRNVYSGVTTIEEVLKYT
ncbi:GspE/PulE family protein [Akkermansiaceae bacterium]|nr:GspE/PulE family protein [Akkermansiaceae bacterium]